MTWTEQDSERLFGILEGCRHILATCCAAIERACNHIAPPPPSSKPSQRPRGSR